MEHFSAPTLREIATTPQSRKLHAVFHSFLSDDRNKYSDTTIAHSKQIIKLSNQRDIMSAALNKIWENTDGCAEHYRCVTDLVSMLSQDFSIIINHGIFLPGHDIKLVYYLNATEKVFFFNYDQL